MLSVRGLLPPQNDGVNEKEVSHVQNQEADHADDHHNHHLDHSCVSLLISAHTSRTKGFWKFPHMLLLNIETGDDNIETVTVAENMKDKTEVKESMRNNLGGTFLI